MCQILWQCECRQRVVLHFQRDEVPQTIWEPDFSKASIVEGKLLEIRCELQSSQIPDCFLVTSKGDELLQVFRCDLLRLIKLQRVTNNPLEHPIGNQRGLSRTYLDRYEEEKA